MSESTEAAAKHLIVTPWMKDKIDTDLVFGYWRGWTPKEFPKGNQRVVPVQVIQCTLMFYARGDPVTEYGSGVSLHLHTGGYSFKVTDNNSVYNMYGTINLNEQMFGHYMQYEWEFMIQNITYPDWAFMVLGIGEANGKLLQHQDCIFNINRDFNAYGYDYGGTVYKAVGTAKEYRYKKFRFKKLDVVKMIYNTFDRTLTWFGNEWMNKDETEKQEIIGKGEGGPFYTMDDIDTTKTYNLLISMNYEGTEIEMIGFFKNKLPKKSNDESTKSKESE